MQDRHAVAEACPEAAHGLRCERDLGHEDDHAEVAVERRRRGLQVDLGLPAAGGAVEEEMAAALVVRAPEPGERTLLRGRQRLRLRLAFQSVPLGRLRQHLAARALRRGDERERAAGRRAVVVRDPERELDERSGQRLDDALDRDGLDPRRGRVLEIDHNPSLTSPAEPDRDDVPAYDILGHLVRERACQSTRRHERIDRGVVRHAPQASGTARHASRFPDVSLSVRMRVGQCLSHGPLGRALSGARRPAEPGSAGRERVAGQGSEIRLRRLR